MAEDSSDEQERSGVSAIPLLEFCPACGSPVEGAKCKVYCSNDRCILFRRVIENCAGD